MRVRVVHTQKSVQFAAHKDRHGDQALDALRVQAVILDAPRRIVLQRVHILDDIDLAVLISENIHPQRNDLNGKILQVIFFRCDTISANLIGVVRNIACPVKLEDVALSAE